MIKSLVFLFFFAGSMAQAQTQTQIQLPQTVLLWPNGAPGAQGTEDIDKPTITVYPISGPQKVPTAVVVFPGGGYVHLAMGHEGEQIAAWLNSYGITAFVVRYRLGPRYHYPIQLQDAQRAIRYARAHAVELGVDPHRIGIWGFSAGGHLASTAGTHFDAGNPSNPDVIEQQSSRPDFMILAYPVITMQQSFTHQGSRNALLGPNPDPALVELLSNERQVTPETPPTFLFATSDDAVVPVQNSVQFYLALQAAHIPVEMHIYEHGAHGAGLARNNPELSTWPDLLADWLKHRGLR